jgi:hypothetical protein
MEAGNAWRRKEGSIGVASWEKAEIRTKQSRSDHGTTPRRRKETLASSRVSKNHGRTKEEKRGRRGQRNPIRPESNGPLGLGRMERTNESGVYLCIGGRRGGSWVEATCRREGKHGQVSPRGKYEEVEGNSGRKPGV